MGRTTMVAFGIALIIIVWVLSTFEPVPRSHAEAIALHLRNRNISVQHVNVIQQWPNALPFYAYGTTAVPYQASVVVQLISGHTISGFMVCYAVPHNCFITIRDFLVFSEPVIDINMSVSGIDWLRAQWSKLITL